MVTVIEIELLVGSSNEDKLRVRRKSDVKKAVSVEESVAYVEFLGERGILDKKEGLHGT